MTTTNVSTTTNTKTKIIVLDDDPTGSQTVHSCPLLTQWDVETLMWALQDDTSPLFFVLTNTRGMSSTDAETLTRQVCHNLKVALQQLASSSSSSQPGSPLVINPLLVSRSDSTLRGHYPVETNVIADELGPFDAHFLVPAFFEGGRITKNSIHYLLVDSTTLVPCHETEFAKDSVFGYTTAYLPKYVEEKTKGKIHADQVVQFQHTDVDVMSGNCQPRLLSLQNNTCCVVDAITQSELDQFCQQLLTLTKSPYNKRFLFRSGASLLTSLAQLPPQPIPPQNMSQYVPYGRPGVVLVGSHVQKTTSQLSTLLQQPGVVGMEVDVGQIQQGGQKQQSMMLEQYLGQISQIHQQGHIPVIYTSRTELVDFPTQEQRLVFGQQVSSFLMDIVHGLPPTIGFLVSKGGITSNDVLSKGLALQTSFVLGQVLAGCSVVKCPNDHPRFPNLPVVIFPGNVGDENALVTVLQRLTSSTASASATTGTATTSTAAAVAANHNDPNTIHKLITRRFKELRSHGVQAKEAMQQARDELAPSDEFQPDVGTQVAAMFGIQL